MDIRLCKNTHGISLMYVILKFLHLRLHLHLHLHLHCSHPVMEIVTMSTLPKWFYPTLHGTNTDQSYYYSATIRYTEEFANGLSRDDLHTYMPSTTRCPSISDLAAHRLVH